MHIPFDKFTEEKATELVELLMEKQYVVFLCMYSKQPGPSCASDYARMRVKYHEKEVLDQQRVLVLSGGMNGVMKEWLCSEKPEGLIEEYDERMWKMQTDIGLIHIHDLNELNMRFSATDPQE